MKCKVYNAKEIVSSTKGRYCYLIWFISEGCVIRSDISNDDTIFNILNKKYGNSVGNVERISRLHFEYYKHKSFSACGTPYRLCMSDLIRDPFIFNFFDKLTRKFDRLLKKFKN